MNHTTSNPEFRTLELINSRLALESTALESFSETVRRIVPSLSSSLKTFAANSKAVFANQRGVSNFNYSEAEFESLVRTLEGHKYTNLMDLRFYIPEGFKGNITAYAVALQNAQKHVSATAADVVVPYNIFISKLLTNPIAVKDTRLQMINLGKIKQAREFLKAQLGEYFQPGSTASTCKLGDAVTSNSDWKPLRETLKIINNDFDPKLVKQLNNSVDDSSMLLDELSNCTRESGLRDISPQTLRTLGDGTLEVAREVEFFSLVNYQIGVLLTVMGQNTEFLKKALK